MKKYKKLFLAGVALAVTGLALFLGADDKELFMGVPAPGAIKPNVVVLMDNSGSMNTIIMYPRFGIDGIQGTTDDGYNPRTTYSGTVDGMGTEDPWNTDTTYWYARWLYLGNAKRYDNTALGTNWTGCYADDGVPGTEIYQVGGNSVNFKVGERILFRGGTGYNDALATIKRKFDSGGSPWFELENVVGGPITPGHVKVDEGHFQRFASTAYKPVIARLYGTTDLGYKVRYPLNYLEWTFIHGTDFHRAAVSHFSTYGTFNVNDIPGDLPSNCSTADHPDRIRHVFTRIQVAREVSCKIGVDAAAIVSLGLFTFNGEDGASLKEGLQDMSESDNLQQYNNTIWGMPASSWTPLSEALADVWYYLRPGAAGKPYQPVNLDTAASATHVIEYWCQNNYVILVTDGESTKDKMTSTRFTSSIFKTKPVKRTEPWINWNNGWGDLDNNDVSSSGYIPANYKPLTATYCPNWTCWIKDSDGTDLLDDVAYFMAKNDLFPEKNLAQTLDLYSAWPGKQCVYTYTIGFNADNDMLRATATNGDAAYYTASDYDELVNAFQMVFTSILLRNFAFSAITAPKKTATATSIDLAISYVGYFMPSLGASIWEGHMLAYRLIDKWGFDEDDSGDVGSEEFVYDTEGDCQSASAGKICARYVDLSAAQDWDARDKIPVTRNLFTHHDTSDLITFTSTNRDTLKPLFGAGLSDAEGDFIITKIRTPQLGDIFHSDVAFVGPPQVGKKFVGSTDPIDPADERYETFYENHSNRRRAIYTGSNDGILHMFYADDPTYADGRDAGKEVWGFIPDTVLPSLKKIVLDGIHTYTVDGRLSAQDIFYVKPGNTTASWSTTLAFGLRQGGNSYHQLDISNVGATPTMMWEFEDPVYSGQSWGRPIYGRIKLYDSINPNDPIDKWVLVIPAGMAYNSENPNNLQGKGVFIIDAGTGELLWMVGYHEADGASDSASTTFIETQTADEIHHLSKLAELNFPIASSLTGIDKDFDGFMDTVYFGNLGGHLFKLDISGTDMAQWRTSLLYKTNISTLATATIASMLNDTITLSTSSGFEVGQTVKGQTSQAVGYITLIENKTMTMKMNAGAFQASETVVVRSYDPIYVSPVAAFDSCYNLWLCVGTGDRDRPRTAPTKGHLLAIKDNDNLNMDTGDLTQITWGETDSVAMPEGSTIANGWYFSFPDDHEKMFDPEPVIIPDMDMVPHIFVNTYQPPREVVHNVADPCDVPEEGNMILYDIAMLNCGNSPLGTKQQGRISGGGVYEGKEYIMYVGTGGVASVPPLEKTEAKKLPYPGGVVFWKEKKR